VPDSVVSSKLVVRDLENANREPRHYLKLLLKGLAFAVINVAILAGIIALAFSFGLI